MSDKIANANGTRKVRVRWVQARLRLAGHSLTVDGVYGPRTTAALLSFAAQHNTSTNIVESPTSRGRDDAELTIDKALADALEALGDGRLVPVGNDYDVPARDLDADEPFWIQALSFLSSGTPTSRVVLVGAGLGVGGLVAAILFGGRKPPRRRRRRR